MYLKNVIPHTTQTAEVNDLVSVSPPRSSSRSSGSGTAINRSGLGGSGMIPIQRHRRNVSDTSALRLPDPNRNSAFRYEKHWCRQSPYKYSRIMAGGTMCVVCALVSSSLMYDWKVNNADAWYCDKPARINILATLCRNLWSLYQSELWCNWFTFYESHIHVPTSI